MALVAAVGLATVGLGYQVGVVPVVVGLFALGVGNGTWDVAMNVEGSAVEQELGRAIMPRFHAGFSVGTVAGALIGAAMVALGVSATVHLRRRRGDRGGRRAGRRPRLPARPAGGRPSEGERRSPLTAWTEPRTAADRPVRVHRGVHRGHRQRLARRRDHRRLRRGGRARRADVRRLPRRDDARPLVRARADRPPRPRAASSALFGLLALVGLALVVWRLDARRSPWSARRSGGSARRSASPSG